MVHEATLTYTEPLLRQAVFAYWRCTVGVAFLGAMLLVAAGLGVLVMQGDTSWVVGAMATVLVLSVVFSGALYFLHYRASLHKFRAMGSAQAALRVDDASFSIESSIGSVTLLWSSIKELWRFQGFWLLLYSRAQFNILPVDPLSPAMQTFVLQRVRAAGGKVDG